MILFIFFWLAVAAVTMCLCTYYSYDNNLTLDDFTPFFMALVSLVWPLGLPIMLMLILNNALRKMWNKQK